MKKTNSKKRKEVEVYLPSGPIPVRALTNKQLIEVARYNNPTEEEKKNRKQNTNKVISSLVRPLSISGAIIGGSSRLHKGSRAVLKGAALGTAIGTGIGLASGITLKKLGHKHHKKAAEVAEDELETRNKLGIVYAKPGEWPELDRSNAEYQNKKEKKFSVIMTEDELKLFSEFLSHQKDFSDKESRKEAWEREKKEEIERNKERDELLKKLPKKDLEHASRMWQDGDSAGRIAMRAIDRDHSLLGAGAGYLTAKAGKSIAKRAGKTIKRGGLITAASVYAGSKIASRAGWKHSERVAQDIWNEGDRRVMEFIKADKKTREKMKENYEPINCMWRKNDERKD